MTYTPVNNHVELALSRRLEKFKSSPDWDGILTAHVEQLQLIEDQIYKLYTERSILTAIGAQLDVVGKIVGESRNLRDDIDYREAILTRIQINNAGGEPDTIIFALNQLFKTDKIYYSEFYPLNFQVQIISPKIVDNLREYIKSISPVTVGDCYIIQAIDDNVLRLGGMTTEDCVLEVTSGGVDYYLQLENEGTPAYLNTEYLGKLIGDSGWVLGGTILNQAYLELEDGSYLELEDGSFLDIESENSHEDYTYTLTGGKLGGYIT